MRQLNMFDLVRGFSEIVDLVNNTLANHHHRVAYITDGLCQRLEVGRSDRDRLVMAAMLHDVGVIPLRDNADSLVFEKDMERHSLAGALLLNTCPHFRWESKLIRYHHTFWAEIEALPEEEREAARFGNIIHLADIMDVHARTRCDTPELARALKAKSGREFPQAGVEAALDLFSDPEFFSGLTMAARELRLPPNPELMLSPDEATVFSLLFSHVIDARSSFTATHSSGVAHLARYIHKLAGLPEEHLQTMFVAGLLHDIGKLGVPLNLLEKPGPLTGEEFALVSRHAALSLDVLSSIPGFEKVAPWGALHHEKLNGRGYPGGLGAEELSLESRITAVADVLTALTEDRPYRPGLGNDQTLRILGEMVVEGGLDADLVGLVHENMEDIAEVRRLAQNLARKFFRGLAADIQTAVAGPAGGPFLMEKNGGL